ATSSSGEAIPELTAREAEVLGLLAEGLTNRQIAQRLYVRPLARGPSPPARSIAAPRRAMPSRSSPTTCFFIPRGSICP
ncbi:MAG TPA: helix-turn-helix transcriptional regulator, partial [Actinomycetota bacterium]|nr:helix-turn-helix transcriptional regulator [Actinomycetota bacterium]